MNHQDQAIVGSKFTGLAAKHGLRRFRGALVAAVICSLAGFTACAQTLLLREAVSREFSLHVGGVDDGLAGNPVSREYSIHRETNADNQQAVSREFVLAVHDSATPPPVQEIEVVLSPTGDSLALEWSAYNPWLHRDIGGFRIYLSDTGPFTDVSGMTPLATVHGETTQLTLDGLSEFTDHFIAIVAVDSAGNADPTVVYSAAYVLSPELVSRELSLFVEKGTPQIVSREFDLAVVPASAPPAIEEFIIIVSPLGDQVTLEWPDYNQWLHAPVDHFDVYLSDSGPITDISGLSPTAVARGGSSRIVLDQLATGTDHFFAIVPVDPEGKSDPDVNYGAAYVISPEIVSRELSLHVESNTIAYQQVVSRELDLLVSDAAIPAPVTGEGSGFFVETSTEAFGAVVLDFSDYNEIFQGDVVRYDVYLGDVFFDDVSALTPFASLPAGSQRQTLPGLQGGSIKHFAVVAVDAQENFDPVVRSFSGQASISGVGEIENLSGSSTLDTLSFQWDPPQNASAFLDRYRVHLGAAIPVDLPLTTTSYQASGLSPATGYPFRVSTIDIFGNESPGTSLNAATWLPNPTNPQLTLRNGEVFLVWEEVQPTALVASFNVYSSATPISDVTALSSLTSTIGLEVNLGPLAGIQDQHFAVTTVNPLGDSNPLVASVQASKQAQTIDFPQPLAGASPIPLSATASSGRVVGFSVSPVGTATVIDTPGGPALEVLRGGPVDITASQEGDVDYWPATPVTRSLRIPPQITFFTASGIEIGDGVTLGRLDETLQVVADDVDGISKAEFFIAPDGGSFVSLGIDLIPGDGLTANLATDAFTPGNYQLKVRVDTAGGDTAERVHAVILDLLPPSAPQIVSPLNGDTFDLPTITLSGFSERSAQIMIASNGSVVAGPVSADAAGNFLLTVPLFPGSNSLTASASNPSGSGPASAAVGVTLRSSLELVITPPSLAEGDSGILSVSRNHSQGDLSVTLSAGSSGQLNLPASLSIADGSSQASTPISAIDDTVAEPDVSVSLSASASGYISGNATLTVLDDDRPALTLSANRSVIAEGSPTGDLLLTITRQPITDTPFTVFLDSDMPDSLRPPATVVIPAFIGTVEVLAETPDNELLDGDRLSQLSARIFDVSSGELLVESLPLGILVTDDDGPALTLTLAQQNVREGHSIVATVWRNGATTSPLSIQLGLDDPSEASLPISVEIPAGAASVNFSISGTEDGVDDQNQTVLITATATDFSPSEASLIVTDLDLPDLAIAHITAPEKLKSDQTAQYSYRIENQGTVDISKPVTVRVLLSRDSLLGDDEELNRYVFEGGLPSGLFFERSESFFVPRETGEYHILIQLDAEEALTETLETNNFASSSSVLVEAAYLATVSTSTTVAPSGSDVALIGQASQAEGGAPAAFVLVNVHIMVRDTLRIQSALTDSAGNFNTVFRPLPGEGGVYRVGAVHPGVAVADAQDSFTLLGFSSEPGQLSAKLFREGDAFTGALALSNLTDLAANGIVVSGHGLPSGITISGSLAEGALALAPLGTATLNFEISASSAAPGEGAGVLRVTSSEGALLDIPLVFTARDQVSRLVGPDAPLEHGMIPGVQSFVNFTVTNEGGVDSGPLRIILPSVPWLTTASGSPIPPIPAGGAATISLQLNPPAEIPLTAYQGTLMVADDFGSIAVPFSFRAVSENTGELVVHAEDEYTYWAAGNPPLADCEVVICDAIDGSETARGTTAANGSVSFPALREGYYLIKASADKHSGFNGSVNVQPGGETSATIFLPRNTVTYTWNVVPTRIPDRYRIVIETEFETNVPIPVVTVEPSYIDLDALTEDSNQINLTITNHGLIAADDLALNFNSSSEWEITALASKLGRIPAKSSLTVPITITRIAPGARASACGASGSLIYKYICGTNKVGRSAAIGFSGTEGCGGGSVNPHGGGSGGGSIHPVGVAGGGVVSCDPCVLKALIDCGIGFIPNPIFTCSYAATGTIITCYTEGLSVNCVIDVVQTGLGCACGFTPYGNACNAANCFIDILQCLAASGGAAGGGRSSYSEILQNFENRGRGVVAMVDFEIAFYGDEAFRELMEDPDFPAFGDLYKSFTAGPDPAASQIDAAERAQLLASPIGLANTALVNALADRWNRTLNYWSLGIFEEADVPDGQSTDFLKADVLNEVAIRVDAAFVDARADGYDDPVGAFGAALDEMFQFLSSGGGVCARVKLRIEQDAVMTRDAFAASLVLENDSPNPIENLEVSLTIRDSDGFDASDRFGIDGPRMTGIDGSTIVGNSEGSWEWTLIPSQDAAPIAPVNYLVEGELRYQQEGQVVIIPMAPRPITVHPNPNLRLKYFHQRDVFSDDPHTDIIEPAIPFTLGLMVENDGAGIASNFRVTSGQPEIVENEKGLFIDFEIIATEVSGQALSPGLTADFGDLAPGEIKVGRWLMTSTLQGLFLNYTAEFEHLDSLGNERLSLIESVEIHEMLHQVQALGSKDDGLPDFLVNDSPDPLDLPDAIHLSDGSVEAVAVSTNATAETPSLDHLSIELTGTGLASGWGYLRIPDPADGNFRLISCQRSDGLSIPLDINVWTTDRTFVGLGLLPIRENILHLVDCDSTGSFTLTYQVIAPPDTTAPTSSVATLPSDSGSFVEVMWSGNDDQGIVSYDIWVSRDGGPFELWLEDTSDASALFSGEFGSGYDFYSIARDAAGNREAPKTAGEASTTISERNQPPQLTAAGPFALNEGQTLSFRMAADDPDGPNDLLRFSVSAPHPGVVIDSRSGRLRWITGEEDGGTSIDAVVTVTDGDPSPLSATQTVTITVDDINASPIFAAPGSYAIDVGEALELTLSATDPDVPVQGVSFRLVDAPLTGFTLDSVTGAILWTPGDEHESQTFEIAIQAFDDQIPEGVTTRTLYVEVLEKPGLPPEFGALPVLTWKSSGSYQFTVSASDPEGQAVTVSADLSELVGGWSSFSAQHDSGQGTLSWSTYGVSPGIYEVPLTASTFRQSTSGTLVIEIQGRDAYNSYSGWSSAYDLEEFDALHWMVHNPQGISNLFAYAYGMDPRGGVVADQPHPGPVAIPGQFGISFTMPDGGLPDLRYVVERSDANLQSWTDVATKDGLDDWTGAATIVDTVLQGNLIRTNLTFDQPPAGQSVFFRLRVEFNAVPLLGYSSWISSFAVPDPDPFADADGNGYNNLMSWGLGHASPLEIASSEQSDLPHMVMVMGVPALQIKFLAGARSDTRYLIEGSANLTQWAVSAVKDGSGDWFGPLPVIIGDQATPGETWLIFPSGSHAFLRLSILPLLPPE